MAELSPETTGIVNRLKQQSLDILDEGTAAAFHLNEQAGETEATLPFFDELQAATEDAPAIAKIQFIPQARVSLRRSLEISVSCPRH